MSFTPLKYNVTTGAGEHLLEIAGERFVLTSNGTSHTGTASIVEVQPGLFSLLFADGASFSVQVVRTPAGLDVISGATRFALNLADVRDQGPAAGRAKANGPAEMRSQMPGKIIQVLAEPGAPVHAGDPLLIIEAMKMQNEVKAPKDGTVRKILVTQGVTVGAGELLVVLE